MKIFRHHIIAGLAMMFAFAPLLTAQEDVDAYSRAEASFYSGEYGAAVRTALEGLNEEPAKSVEASAVELYSILGASYARLGAFDKAADYFVRCYDFDKQQDDPKGLSSSLINLASMYVYAGKPELAEQYVLEAISVEKPLERPAKLAMAYGKACDVYHALAQEETALEYANLAVETAKESGNEMGVAIRRSQRAYPLTALGRLREASTDLHAAEKVFRDLDNKQSLAIVCFQLAQLNTQQGIAAGQYFSEAKKLAGELQDLPLLQKVCSAYAEYLRRSNPSEAFALLEEASELQSRIESGKSSNALELYNIEFETARREQTIAAQEMELQNQRRVRTILITVLVVLLAAAIFTYVQARRTRRSERKLRQLNAQKDFLFKVISHDILSPAIAQLRGIQMLRKHSGLLSDDQYTDAMLQLERQAESEVELIENVLRWARSKDGMVKGEAVRFELDSMAAEAIKQYASAAEQKGIELRLLSPGDIVVCSNRSNLLLALRNLLSNAIKFSRQGGVVRIGITPTKRGADLSVSDDGIGIPADQVESIFNPESAYRRSGTAGEPSNGLGLVVSRDLVEAIGGSLSVSSEEGKGCSFTIHIVNSLENA